MPYYLSPWQASIGLNGSTFYEPLGLVRGGNQIDLRADSSRPGYCLLYTPNVLADPRLIVVTSDDTNAPITSGARTDIANTLSLPSLPTSTRFDGLVREILTTPLIPGYRTFLPDVPLLIGPQVVQAPALIAGASDFLDTWMEMWREDPERAFAHYGVHPVSGGSRTTQDTDSFTGTDNTDLTVYNAKWIQLFGESVLSYLEIESNGVGSTNTGAERTKYTTAWSAPSDQWATISMAGTKATYMTKACVNLQAAAQSGYSFGYDANNDGATDRIYKESAGAFSALTAAGAATPTVGDTFDLENQAGTLTAVLSGGHSDTVSVADASFTGGQPGIQVFPSVANIRNADDWLAGDFSAAATTSSFRRTLSLVGTRTGTRQVHGWGR